MSKPHLAEVVPIYETNASDIAAMLRQCAKSIDDGANPKSIIAVVTEDDGTLTLYGWGATDSMNTLGTLHLAILQHGRGMMGG
jgi:hypothetical protein